VKTEYEYYQFFLSNYLSNWYKSQFKDKDGITYNCMEQYIVYQSAKLFNDNKTAKNVLKTQQPRFQKNYLNEIRGFNKEIWLESIEDILFEGNILKFEQNSRLKKELLKTIENELVEANPNDSIMGIGMSEDEPNLADKVEEWGMNLSGKSLMKVRDYLLNKN
jgi:hypothetical protein